ncbi:MAG: hypothetical protein U1F34_03335 [Gammaproteobacteria bacterium]
MLADTLNTHPHAPSVRGGFATTPFTAAVALSVSCMTSNAWALCRAVLSMLMQAEGGLRAVTGIGDAAVAVADSPDFFAEVSQCLQRQSLRYFVYGPVGMGSLHIRPELICTHQARWCVTNNCSMALQPLPCSMAHLPASMAMAACGKA